MLTQDTIYSVQAPCVHIVTFHYKYIVGFFSVHMVGRHEGRVFEDREVEFVVGEGSVKGVVPGVEEGVMKMNKGETARSVFKY